VRLFLYLFAGDDLDNIKSANETMARKLRSSTTRLPRVALALCLSVSIAGTLISGARAEEVGLKVTEDELKQYRGENPGDPIYLAIDGQIFDVSASPAFYGPGGHYCKSSNALILEDH